MADRIVMPPTSISILRCKACGVFDPGPRHLCPACHAPALAAEDVAGVGTLVASTFIRRPPLRFKAEGAYSVAVVALDIGVSVVGRIEDGSHALAPGTRVELSALREGYPVFAEQAVRSGNPPKIPKSI